MNVQQAASEFEHLYFAVQKSPFRLCIDAGLGLAVGLDLAFVPSPWRWWFPALYMAWYYFVGPFLSGLLPFSETARAFWKTRRKHRQESPFAEPDRWLASGIGLLIAGLLEFRFVPEARRTGVLDLSLLIIAIAALRFIISHLARRFRGTRHA